MLDLDAGIYANSNQTQQTGALYVLDHYLGLVKWRRNPSVMDVGTGDGTVLLNVLLPRLQQDFEKIVAVDINDDMLNIAKNMLRRNPKVEFVHMDVATVSLPVQFLENFDHIFSFFCFHWIVDQRRAFTNLFDMLKPEGNVLLTFIAKNSTFGVHEKMQKIDKWAPFMTDIKNYPFSYHHSLNPVLEIKDHLKIVGFVDYVVKLEPKVQTYKNLSEFWQFSCGINPFIKRIPNELLDLYKSDYLNEIRRSALISFKEGGEIYMPYELLVVYAAKPETVPKIEC